MKKYPYYPGCSAKGTGKAYEESLLGEWNGSYPSELVNAQTTQGRGRRDYGC